MIVTSEAIVLRARKQGETSKIATLYTADYGKLNVIAKGAREIKSKFGGALEMFARVSAVFYKKEKDEPGLYLLSKIDLIESNSGILQSLDRIGPAMAIVELVLRAMHDEEAHPQVFRLLAETFHACSSAVTDSVSAPLEFRFYMEFARMMGFEVDLEMASDGIAEMVQSMRATGVLKTTFDERSERQLRSFFQSYFVDHLPGISGRAMRSGRVFGQL